MRAESGAVKKIGIDVATETSTCSLVFVLLVLPTCMMQKAEMELRKEIQRQSSLIVVAIIRYFFLHRT